jgi:hypothetical protein
MSSHMHALAAFFDIQLTYVTLYCTFGLRLCSRSGVERLPLDGAGWHSWFDQGWLEESHQIRDQGKWFAPYIKEIPLWLPS